MPVLGTVGGMDSAGTTYLWKGRSLVELQLHHLAGAFDPMTLMRLATIGVKPGWRCLEVGAGTGTIARALAAMGAQVVATDVDLTHLEAAPGVTTLQHDITRDPLPEGEYDLIHARCVLMHLPRRRDALAAMVRALRPGGWLLVEDIDGSWQPTVLAAPHPEAERLYGKAFDAMRLLLTTAGADGDWASGAYAALGEHGLVDVASAAHAESWPSGSHGRELLRVHTVQLREPFLSAGVSVSELDRYATLLADPGFAVMSWLIIGIWGRRPTAHPSS